MSVLPPTRLAQIEWFEQRLASWIANATDIGLTSGQVTALQTKIAAARMKYLGSQQARNASKAATVDYYDASDDLVGDGRDLIKTIKAYAETTGDTNVYVLAEVPPPADPGTVPPPGTPTGFTATLLQSGAVKLRWKCDNPPGSSGTVYEVFRSDAGGPLTFQGNAGEREFIDSTIPANTNSVSYRVTGVRTTVRGDPANFAVQFGAGNGNNSQEGSGEGNLSIAA